MKKIISLILVLIILLSISAVSAFAYFHKGSQLIYDDEIDLSYREEIAPYFYPEYFEGKDVWIYYDMQYADPQKDEQGNPKYIVFIGLFGIGDQAIVEKSVGDCYVMNYWMDYPYDLGHYVYVPNTHTVYTLEQAYESEEIDITDALESGRVGVHRGDVNLDKSFDIIDACYIQKFLSAIDGYTDNGRLDFDRDGEATVLDATAIQKRLAKIDV